MDLSNLYSSLGHILPEIALSIGLLVLVLFDLIFDTNKKPIPYLALAGIIITGYLVIDQLALNKFAFPSGGQTGMVAIDSFAAYFKLIILLASFFIILFSFSSDEIIKTGKRQGEYYALIYGMILGMLFMVSANDLILVYLSVELLSLSSYVLSGFTKLRERNSEAALKYLIYGSVSSGLMLFGISLMYGITGSTNFIDINTILLTGGINLLTLSFSTIMIFVGLGFKISAAPFHFWTPDVYEGAPITITAFLSVASKAAGFALLIRIVGIVFISEVEGNGNWILLSVFDWEVLLTIISILTMTLGNFAALWQDNLKRMLAYSSIAHAGYILLGLVVFSNQGLIAILIYFFVYLLMNLGSFYVVMLIANQTGTENIDDYNGIGYTSPFLSIALAIFLISLTGLPPTAGFIAKLYLFIALVDAQLVAVAVIALLNTVVSLYYYVRVLKHMYLTKPEVLPQPIIATTGQRLLTLALLIPVLVFGIYFTPIVDFAKSCITILGL